MNLIQLQNTLKYDVSRQYLNPNVMLGSIYENLNTGEIKYPAFNIDIEQFTEEENDVVYDVIAYFADRLTEDNSNKSNIKTDAITSMQLFIDTLKKRTNLAIETPIEIHLFEQQFVDKCAGSWCRLRIHTGDYIDYCNETIDLNVKEIDENGNYNVQNYDYVIVNVKGDKAEWGKITGNIENQTDLIEYIKGQTPNIQPGDNVYFYRDGSTVIINAVDTIYNDAMGAFYGMEKLNKYLYSIEYNTINYGQAIEHYLQNNTGEGFGHCSTARYSGLFARNYDWTINKQVEFILKTKAQGRFYSVTGMATAAAFDTDIMEGHVYIDEYEYLPFRLVDGINEKGLVCAVNELPVNNDGYFNINVDGTIPEVEERETIPMIMLVRYILDRFEFAQEAADYIKDYVKVMPIIGEDGTPMNFHFAIADKNVTVYLYFNDTEVKYEVVDKTERNFVMTNFRLQDTVLDDGHYTTTGSNIEEWGQGIERANLLIDYPGVGGDILDYFQHNVGFTKAYTTDERLTDFAGIDGVTIDDEEALREIQADAAQLFEQELNDGTLRDDADLWQTVHTILYDLTDKHIELKIQEIEGSSEVFTFNPYPRVEIDFTPTEIEPTTTNFVVGTTYSIYNALQRVVNLFEGYWNYIKENITDLIPSQASSTNQLADKDFVNQTVAQNAANFRGNWAKWTNVPTTASEYPEDYVGNHKPNNNDYLVVTDASDYSTVKEYSFTFRVSETFNEELPKYSISCSALEDDILFDESAEIIVDNFNMGTVQYVGQTEEDIPYFKFICNRNCKYNNEDHIAGDEIEFNRYSKQYYNAVIEGGISAGTYTGSWRFLYIGNWDEVGKSGWQPTYRIGSAFTSDQQAAIDSTITKEKVDAYDGYESRITAVETDKRDNIYEANKLYATDAEGKQVALDITSVQAHNYASLTNKPTINGVEVSGDKTSNDYKIYTKEVAKTGTNIALKANELTTVIATEDVTVSLDTSADLTDGVNEYRLQLAANAPITITFNIVGLKWSYDVPNYLVSGKVYEISIINKHATYLVF